MLMLVVLGAALAIQTERNLLRTGDHLRGLLVQKSRWPTELETALIENCLVAFESPKETLQLWQAS